MKSVLAIDPGSSKSAFVLWDGKEILYSGHRPNEDVIAILYAANEDAKVNPALAIESMVSIPQGGGKSICDTIWWSGRFYEAWQGKREMVPVHVIKKALGAKNDLGIRTALIQRFGPPGKKADPGLTYGLQGTRYHLWRAFAVAVVWYDHLEFQGKMLA